MPPPCYRVMFETDSETSGDENAVPTQATCGSQPTKQMMIRTEYTDARNFASCAGFDDFWNGEGANASM
ncbi:hypothetical protein AAVH_18587, partial [Aphelenchoides avenae]